MAAVRNGNCSLYEVLNQDILNNNCVERPVDYLQKLMVALGSFTREKSCQNVAFFVDECAEQVQTVQYVVQFSDSKVFSHYILRFKMFRRFKFVQMTTTSHGYITLRDTSLKFFSFSVISKTSTSFLSPHFGQLVRYSDTYNNSPFFSRR